MKKSNLEIKFYVYNGEEIIEETDFIRTKSERYGECLPDLKTPNKSTFYYEFIKVSMIYKFHEMLDKYNKEDKNLYFEKVKKTYNKLFKNIDILINNLYYVSLFDYYEDSDNETLYKYLSIVRERSLKLMRTCLNIIRNDPTELFIEPLLKLKNKSSSKAPKITVAFSLYKNCCYFALSGFDKYDTRPEEVFKKIDARCRQILRSICPNIIRCEVDNSVNISEISYNESKDHVNKIYDYLYKHMNSLSIVSVGKTLLKSSIEWFNPNFPRKSNGNFIGAENFSCSERKIVGTIHSYSTIYVTRRPCLLCLLFLNDAYYVCSGGTHIYHLTSKPCYRFQLFLMKLEKID